MAYPITNVTNNEYHQFCITMADKIRATTDDAIRSQKYLNAAG
jgi:hypothetical protein